MMLRIVVVGRRDMVERVLERISGGDMEMSVFQLGVDDDKDLYYPMIDEFARTIHDDIDVVLVDNNWGNGRNITQRIPTNLRLNTIVGFRYYLLGDEVKYDYTHISGLTRFCSWRRFPALVTEFLACHKAA